MNLLIKYISYFFITIFLFCCSGGNSLDNSNGSDYDYDDDESIKCNATCLTGTLIDTLGGEYAVANAKVSTIPSVNQIVETDEDGVFWIDSDQFLEDVKYLVNIQKTGFIANSPSNLRVKLDTITNLQKIVLIKMPTLDTDIDEMK